MKVCVPCRYPGGPEAAPAASFEDSDLFDYYEVHAGGSFVLTAETRPCLGGCSDPVEAVLRRGVEAVIVRDISPDTLMRLRNASVKVYKGAAGRVRELIMALAADRLEEIDIGEFGRLGRKKGKGV